MAEAVEQIVKRKSPLGDTHARLGATMIERDGWQMPAHYGDVLLDYAAVREGGAGLIDLSPRGRILVSGSEAVQFLNGLITNDMKTLEANTWMTAAFPSVQGRLIASVRVIRLEEEKAGTDRRVCPTFLLDTEAATHERVLKTIERFTLAGDFHVKDITNQTALISVQGRKSADLVRTVLGETAASFGANRATQVGCIRTGGSDREATAASNMKRTTDVVTVLRASHTSEYGFDLIVESNQAADLWDALQDAGARPVGYDALEILRIEAGQPRYGVDMDETNVVTESLDDAVSYTKGCYIGQEIIARIKYRGHVAKKLTGIAFPQAAKVEAGAVIKSADGKEIGRITSAVYSPHLGHTVALAYLKYDYLAPDTRIVVVSGNEELPGEVTELPFVKMKPPVLLL